MSGTAVIETVSEIMVSLLEREMEKPPSGKYSITLKSPLEDIEDKDSQGVNIFLYQILENADLRNQPWIREGNNRLRYPPLFLNLHYLIIPYAKTQREVHRIMTETMRVFHDYSNQDLSAGNKPVNQLKIVLEPLSIEDIFKIWRALNRPYRLSASYCVQVAQIDSKKDKEVELVKERDIRYHKMSVRNRG
ncbi:MAG: DUF4255 domain-containing protein [bacterium]